MHFNFVYKIQFKNIFHQKLSEKPWIIENTMNNGAFTMYDLITLQLSIHVTL